MDMPDLDNPSDVRPDVIYFRTQAPHHLPLGSEDLRKAIRCDAIMFWLEQVHWRDGKLLGSRDEVIQARHRHELDGLHHAGCVACSIEERLKKRHRAPYRVVLTVSRTADPEELIWVPKVPKQHKLRHKALAYHKRIQKKWNKRAHGQFEQQLRREVVKLSLSPIAVAEIRNASLLS